MISQGHSLQRGEYLKKKRNKKLLKYGFILFSTIFFIVSVVYIFHQSSIRISKIELTGKLFVKEKDIEEKSLEFISGSYLWLFPKNNILLYPRKALEKYLKNSFKRIDTININTKNFHTLEIKIMERKPEALWCTENIPIETNLENQASSTTSQDASHSKQKEKCYFMDSNSTIFAEAPEFSGDAYFRYYGLVDNGSPIGTEYIASTTQFRDITEFVSFVRELSIKPLYIVAKEKGEFSMVISGGGKIYFDTKVPISTIKENLEALLRTEPLTPKPNRDLPIDYIDLRYGNKLFYKLR